ncbi:MAG TPA: DUF1993 domain-containing protein [Steroidobacteraceae bacterium]|jgi:hypothetical protein|nr:DUF1993 domain-containing protein [Steroidobacteraceae bacterium]
MKISMHAMTHDVFKKSLTQLLHVMEKGVANAKARNFDPNVLASSRLAPDMFTFAKQIQLTSDFAKNSMARLAGIEAPKYEDTESTMDELVARVKKTIDYIDTIPASALEGSETRDIRIPLRDRTVEFKGLPYLQYWAIPNFFFHFVTAYNLLRHNGVDIGKRDFLGG